MRVPVRLTVRTTQNNTTTHVTVSYVIGQSPVVETSTTGLSPTTKKACAVRLVAGAVWDMSFSTQGLYSRVEGAAGAAYVQ